MSQLPRLPLLLLVAAALTAGAWVFLDGDDAPRGRGGLQGGATPAALGEGGGAREADLGAVDGPAADSAARRAAAEANAGAGPRRAPTKTAGLDAPRLASGPYKGRLLDSAGGPVANADIELRPWSDRQDFQPRFGPFGPEPWPVGKSDKSGRFTVPHDPRIGKAIGVVVDARGFLDAPFQHVLADAAQTDLGDLYLERAVIVQGWVHDERGAAIAGARLRLGDRDEDMQAQVLRAFGMGGLASLGETDAFGRYELTHIRPGEVTLIAEHPEHHSARWTGETPAAGSVLTPVEFELQRAGAISGVVAGFPQGRRGVQVAARRLPDAVGAAVASEGEASGGNPLLDAMLSPAGDETADVADDGAFEVQGLARTGRYELTVVERQDFVRTVALSQVVAVESGARGVVLDYDAGATVRLRLLDAETLEPIETGEVTGNWGEQRARVFMAPDAISLPKRFPGGEMQLYELRPPTDPGSLSLKVSARGYVEQRLPSFDVGARAVVDLGDVKLEPAPKLRFHIVDRTTGKGISRAQVGVREPNEAKSMAELWQGGMDVAGRKDKDRTGKDGRVALDSLAGPVATLTVRANGYPTYRDDAFDPTDTEREHRITLLKGGDLEVYAVDPAGQPVARARVLRRTVGVEGSDDAEDTNGDGLARWRAIEPGRYEVRAHRRGADVGGEEAEWTAVDVVSDRTSEVVLAVGGAATLTGSITSGGAPLGGAQVSLTRRATDSTARGTARMQRRFGGGRGGAGGGDTTDAEGRFELAEVVPGEYDLVIGHRSLVLDALEPVDLSLGENRVDVRLVVAAIEGRIVDDEGGPIAGARVSAATATSGADPAAGQRQRSFRGMMRDDSRDARTDAEGLFRITGLVTAEPIELYASADGHVAKTSPSFLLGAAETRTGVELRLARAGSAEVLLVSETPNPAAAMVRAKWIGEGAVDDVIEVARGSSCVVDGLAPGTWEFSLSNFGGPGARGGATGATARAEIKAGERAAVELAR